MVINNILDYIFTNASNLAVLRVLNQRIVGISGRETARLAGVSLRSAQISLANLVNLKIIKRQIGGREHLFTLNRGPVLFQMKLLLNFFLQNKNLKLLFIKILLTSLKISPIVLYFSAVLPEKQEYVKVILIFV